MREFGRTGGLGAGRLLSMLVLFMTTCTPALDRPIPDSVAEFELHFQSIPFDPIQMTASGRLHGWTAGEGLLAHLLMYEATKKMEYLEQFAEGADRLLDLRDSERGLPDSLGRLLPVWKTGDRRPYEVALRWYMQHAESWKDVSPEAELYDPDPIAKQNNLRHRMRLGWAALAWTASQISE